MLLQLKHLLVVIGTITAAVVLAASLRRWLIGHGVSDPVAIPVGMAIGSLFAGLVIWPIFRVLKLRPLILPICPHCGLRHGNYHFDKESWPVGVLICTHCEQPVTLVLTEVVPPGEKLNLPTLRLRRPRFLGVWKRV